MRNGLPAVEGETECRLGTPIFNPATGRDEGVFAHWAWDGERLRAKVDPLGFFSLFMYQGEETIALSPSILQLIAIGASTEPDRRALGVFHRLGMFINDDTPFRRIRTLPPDGHVIWQDGSATVTGDAWIPATRDITRDEAIDGIIELPRAGLRNCLRTFAGDLFLPLSGGRDSRHILLDLDHLGRRPKTCLTFQQSSDRLDDEAQAARAVCREMGVRHEVLGRPRARLPDIFSALVLTSLCSDEHSQMIAVHDYLATVDGAALDGIAGDILTNPDDDAEAHFARAQRGDFGGIAVNLLHGHRQVISRTKSATPPDASPLADTDDETVAYLSETIGKFSGAADPYQAFWFWNRTRREIGFTSSAVLAGAGKVFSPFLDTRFVDFGLSLPFRVTRDQQLHTQAIARAYPQVSDIPYAEAFSTRASGRFRAASRIRQVAQAIRLIHALRPSNEIGRIANYLGGSPTLNRRPHEISLLHDLAMENMTPGFAKKLLALYGRYHETQDGVIATDIHPETPDL